MSVEMKKPSFIPPIVVQDSDIESLLMEFEGNPKEAIRALLHDLAVLADDRDNSVSYGYVRGQLFNNKTLQPHKTKTNTKG
jgi:hypothetical protein